MVGFFSFVCVFGEMEEGADTREGRRVHATRRIRTVTKDATSSPSGRVGDSAAVNRGGKQHARRPNTHPLRGSPPPTPASIIWARARRTWRNGNRGGEAGGWPAMWLYGGWSPVRAIAKGSQRKEGRRRGGARGGASRSVRLSMRCDGRTYPPSPPSLHLTPPSTLPPLTPQA